MQKNPRAPLAFLRHASLQTYPPDLDFASVRLLNRPIPWTSITICIRCSTRSVAIVGASARNEASARLFGKFAKAATSDKTLSVNPENTKTIDRETVCGSYGCKEDVDLAVLVCLVRLSESLGGCLKGVKAIYCAEDSRSDLTETIIEAINKTAAAGSLHRRPSVFRAYDALGRSESKLPSALPPAGEVEAHQASP